MDFNSIFSSRPRFFVVAAMMKILPHNLLILPSKEYANYYVTIKTHSKQSTNQSSKKFISFANDCLIDYLTCDRKKFSLPSMITS
jgi:hypothetical protein